MRGRRVVAAVAGCIAATASACGVPNDSKPRPIAHDAVPFNLLSPTPTPTTILIPRPASAQVFFLREGRLIALGRPVAAPVTATGLLTALLAGPTTAETANGVETAIGGQIEVRHVSIANGVADINLSSSFASLEGSSQVEAVAQLVFTATSAPSVVAVRFLVEGHPVDVPKGDGTLSSAPLQRGDFASLAPP